jgi:hypothetical protein
MLGEFINNLKANCTTFLKPITSMTLPSGELNQMFPNLLSGQQLPKSCLYLLSIPSTRSPMGIYPSGVPLGALIGNIFMIT